MVALKCVAPKIFLPVTPLWFVGNKSVIFAHDPVAFLLLSTLALMMSRILTPSSNPSAQFCTLKTQAEHYWGVVQKHKLTDYTDLTKHNLIHNLKNLTKPRALKMFPYKGQTVFENHPKYCIWRFQFGHFLPIFVQLKLTCLVTLFDCKLQAFKNSSNWLCIIAFLMNFCTLKT